MASFLEWTNHRAEILLILSIAFVFVALLTKFIRHRYRDNDAFVYNLIKHVDGPLEWLLFVGLSYVGLSYLDNEIIQYDIVKNTALIATIFGVSWLAIRGVYLFSDMVLRRNTTGRRENLTARVVYTQTKVIQRLMITMIIMVGVASSLMVFEEIRTLGVSLLASAGVAGIVLGLAAQKTLGNFFTGIQIAIAKPIRIDDAVVVEGEWGWIEEINLTFVVVKLWDQRSLVLPINYFVDHPFQSWTRRNGDITGSVILHVDYMLPVDEVRAEVDRIVDEHPLWDRRTKSVQVVETTDRSMQVRILVSSSDAPKLWDLRCAVREKLINFIRENYPECFPRLRAELPEKTIRIENNNGEVRSDVKH